MRLLTEGGYSGLVMYANTELPTCHDSCRILLLLPTDSGRLRTILQIVFPVFVKWTFGIIEVDLMKSEASLVLSCKEFLLLMQKMNPVICLFSFER
jgi:hypothetical protein